MGLQNNAIAATFPICCCGWHQLIAICHLLVTRHHWRAFYSRNNCCNNATALQCYKQDPIPLQVVTAVVNATATMHKVMLLPLHALCQP